MNINKFNNSSINFNGRMSVTVWNNYRPVTKHYKTSYWQDKIIINKIIPHTGIHKYQKLSKANTQCINKIVEMVTKKQFPVLTEQKLACQEWNMLYVRDPEFKILNGTEISIEL